MCRILECGYNLLRYTLKGFDFIIWFDAAVEELVTGCRVGATTKDKLRRVIKWVQQSRSTICNIKLQSNQVSSLPCNCFTYYIIYQKGVGIPHGTIKVSLITTS